MATSKEEKEGAVAPVSLDTYLNCLLGDARKTKDRDVDELYLAEMTSKIRFDTLACLDRFRHLKALWLNGNALRRLPPGTFSSTLLLTELYLHDNLLTTIGNSLLRPLTCLRVLSLQNNELVSLGELVGECRRMLALDYLNVSGNPLTQRPNYRASLIYKLPAVRVLDRRRIEASERQLAVGVFEPTKDALRRSISFGSRVPPERGPTSPRARSSTLLPRLSPRLYRHKDRSSLPPPPPPVVLTSRDDVVIDDDKLDLKRREMKRSWMEYKAFGWTEKGNNKSITVRFR